MKTIIAIALLISFAIGALAQGQGGENQQLIRVNSAVTALIHVRVIDGTGAAPVEDQTIVVT